MINFLKGLYGVAFFATLFFLIKGVSALNLSLLILFLYVLATFSFRAAFWAIVASGDYEETSAGYYILIEPPRFLRKRGNFFTSYLIFFLSVFLLCLF